MRNATWHNFNVILLIVAWMFMFDLSVSNVPRPCLYMLGSWYVSNVSIIFDCSMLYYLLFWTILGFIFHFYIIFGTNLLTGGPAQNCCFFAYFSVSKKRNSKRSPNGIKPSGTWFSHRTWSRRLGPYAKSSERRSRGWGRDPLPRGPLDAPPTYSFLLYILTYPQTIRTWAKNLIPPPQLSVSTRSHLGACSGAPPEEGRHHGGLLHHPSLSDEVWVVYLRPSGP